MSLPLSEVPEDLWREAASGTPEIQIEGRTETPLTKSDASQTSLKVGKLREMPADGHGDTDLESANSFSWSDN